jgi:hypothetical protein
MKYGNKKSTMQGCMVGLNKSVKVSTNPTVYKGGMNKAPKVKK